MKSSILNLVCVSFVALSTAASANQATETRITITSQTAGATPFINKVQLSVSDMSALKAIRFTIQPKPGSVTRALSAVYFKTYLAGRGYVDEADGKINVPVFGLYDGYSNTVNLTYFFTDGSNTGVSTTIPTAPFEDACQFNTPVVRQARTSTTALSYDYILAASACSSYSPVILDTDGAVRWVGTAGVREYHTAFFHNGIYLAEGTRLLRMEMDGEVRVVRDYASAGVIGFHHNIDRGKNGLILDANTPKYIASSHLEVDARTGAILKKWNLAKIIGDAMIAGGDNPTGFVRMANGRYDFQAFEDWTHDNAVTYRPSDNSIIISSRENFVICVDYDTSAIKWILGDPAKRWYQYPSLRRFALAAAPGTIAPVGQHSVSITKDNNLLLFDNGQRSAHHIPAGPNRAYSAPRKYKLDLVRRIATEVWNFTNGQTIRSRFRSSVYEDAASNYLVTYARAENPNGSLRAELLGLTAAGEKVFDYSYPTATCCNEAYRALPIHLERMTFMPLVGTSNEIVQVAEMEP
ncbi:MAG: aryl-sulfate sulfotransferase [Chthoniobacterales bacterium]|nr:aryl-sulfate sulfotransferase [Chthoniobacterales bacterium]